MSDLIRITGTAVSRRGVEYTVSGVIKEGDEEVGSPTERWVALSMMASARNLRLVGGVTSEYVARPNEQSGNQEPHP